MKTTLLILMLGLCAFSQEKKDGDDLVLVPKKYLSPEALGHQASAPVMEASKWVGFGKEVGQAMNEGLGAVVAQADRFGTTKVGSFVMFLIAWKVIGTELTSIVLGIPICLLGICLWIWSIKRFFYPKRVLIKREGPFWARAKEWKITEYEFNSSDGRSGCVAIHACFLAAWLLIWVFKIF